MLLHSNNNNVLGGISFQATGTQIGMIVNSLTSIGASFIIAFYFSWKLTFVILCFLPLIGLCGVFQAKMLTGFANDDKKAMEAAGRVSSTEHCRPIDVHFSEKQKAYEISIFIPAGIQ